MKFSREKNENFPGKKRKNDFSREKNEKNEIFPGKKRIIIYLIIHAKLWTSNSVIVITAVQLIKVPVLLYSLVRRCNRTIVD